MAIRLTGMSSGLDTESMIKDLMSAYSTKKQQKVSTATKYSWKMDAWKTLNTKISSFYSKALSSFRYTSTFSSKKTAVSDTTKASVIASNEATVGSQSLAITQLAQSGYLTGGKLTTTDGSAVTADSTLADIGYAGGETSFDVNGTTITLSSSSKISDVVTQMKDAGVNANYDVKNGRIFVSSATSGESGDFEITANGEDSIKALANLGLYTGVSAKGSAANSLYASYVTKNADGTYSLNSSADAAVAKLAETKQLAYQSKANAAMDSLEKNEYYSAAAQEATEKGLSGDEYYDYIKNSLTEKKTASDEELSKKNEEIDAVKTKQTRLEELQKKANQIENGRKDADGNLIAWEDGEEDELKALQEENETKAFSDILTDLNKEKTTITTKNSSITSAQSNIDTYLMNVEKASDDNVQAEAEADLLGKGIAADKQANMSDNSELSKYIANTASASAVRLYGQDAKIYLNGAEFTSNTNSFEINGLTITCTETTGLSEEGKKNVEAGLELTADDYNAVTLTTGIDVDGIYNTVKSFLKEYNDLIKEMDTLYGADSARKYDVLTDEQKDAMSDTEVEAWEKKIKDSLLRRDDSLGSVMDVMKNAMSSVYMVGDAKYSLSTFGINTMSYFLADDGEKGVYHIDGDPDDANTMNNEDKLKSAIAADPESITSFFTQLAKSMYDSMSTLSKSSSSRSFGSFYDDKLMSKQYSSYQTAITDYEKKLNNIEDKYYKQFSNMEVALTKLQSSTNALSSLLGS